MKDRIAEAGIVVGVEGGQARVRLVGGEACRKCGMAALGLCKPGGTGMVVWATDTQGVGIGDRVTLKLNQGAQWQGYAHVYLIPLALFVLGAGVGHMWGQRAGMEYLDVLAAFGGLAVGLPLAHRKLKAMQRSERMEIDRVIERLESPS